MDRPILVSLRAMASEIETVAGKQDMAAIKAAGWLDILRIAVRVIENETNRYE